MDARAGRHTPGIQERAHSAAGAARSGACAAILVEGGCAAITGRHLPHAGGFPCSRGDESRDARSRAPPQWRDGGCRDSARWPGVAGSEWRRLLAGMGSDGVGRSVDTRMQRPSLTEGSISRGLFKFALPILFANVLQSLNGSVNSIWVGRYLGEA